jgi:type IV pilus assembly protein PilA
VFALFFAWENSSCLSFFYFGTSFALIEMQDINLVLFILGVSTMNMQKAQKGFTLIELMIVVAIIGILAAVAIPQYQNYVETAKLSSAAASVESLKTYMANDYQTNGTFPAPVSGTTTADGFTLTPPPNAAVATTGGTSGTITLTFNQTLGPDVPSGSTLTFTANTPATGASNVAWFASETGMTANSAAANYVTAKLNGS